MIHPDPPAVDRSKWAGEMRADVTRPPERHA